MQTLTVILFLLTQEILKVVPINLYCDHPLQLKAFFEGIENNTGITNASGIPEGCDWYPVVPRPNKSEEYKFLSFEGRLYVEKFDDGKFRYRFIIYLKESE
jgi:hypothetical protein